MEAARAHGEGRVIEDGVDGVEAASDGQQGEQAQNSGGKRGGRGKKGKKGSAVTLKVDEKKAGTNALTDEEARQYDEALKIKKDYELSLDRKTNMVAVAKSWPYVKLCLKMLSREFFKRMLFLLRPPVGAVDELLSADLKHYPITETDFVRNRHLDAHYFAHLNFGGGESYSYDTTALSESGTNHQGLKLFLEDLERTAKGLYLQHD